MSRNFFAWAWRANGSEPPLMFAAGEPLAVPELAEGMTGFPGELALPDTDADANDPDGTDEAEVAGDADDAGGKTEALVPDSPVAGGGGVALSAAVAPGTSR